MFIKFGSQGFFPPENMSVNQHIIINLQLLYILSFLHLSSKSVECEVFRTVKHRHRVVQQRIHNHQQIASNDAYISVACPYFTSKLYVLLTLILFIQQAQQFKASSKTKRLNIHSDIVNIYSNMCFFFFRYTADDVRTSIRSPTLICFYNKE